ncbi:hypothetical protein [Parasphingorhabdus sp.]|uniref:hypothetical protein n=1 Tax=Parasphingorhabdus sp. TaxID=2709688 RepID=UPI0032EB1DF4
MRYKSSTGSSLLPPRGYDPAINTRRKDGKISFETDRAAANEDRLRDRKLKAMERKLRKKLDKKIKKKLTALRRKLNADHVSETLASARYMRKLRRWVAGYLWKLTINSGFGRVRFVTVVPRHWEIGADDLHLVDPRQLLSAFRSALNRCGANHARGWMFFYIHGEYEPAANVFHIHVHGLAAGEMIGIFDVLRNKPRFKSRRQRSKSAEGKKAVSIQRVQVRRKRLTNLPDPITYVVQSFWPSRAQYMLNEKDPKRQTRKRRIPEPYHSQYLVWLNRWSFGDMVLTIGLRRTKSGFDISGRKTNIQKGSK